MRCGTTFGVVVLVAVTLHSSPARSGEPGEERPALEFTQEGKDLVVTMILRGRDASHEILTDYVIHPDPSLEGGNEDSVTLSYLIVQNRDISCESRGDNIPARRVTWRLEDYRKGASKFTVRQAYFGTTSAQLKLALPKLKRLVATGEEHKRIRKEQVPPSLP